MKLNVNLIQKLNCKPLHNFLHQTTWRKINNPIFRKTGYTSESMIYRTLSKPLYTIHNKVKTGIKHELSRNPI